MTTRRNFLRAGTAAVVGLTLNPLFDVTGDIPMSMHQPLPPDPDIGEILDLLEASAPFAGIPTFMKQPHSRDPQVIRTADLVVMGVPFDSGTSNRPGTRFGPRAIREQSSYAAAFQPVYPWTDDLTKLKKIVDFGDVVIFPGTGAVELMLEITEAVVAEVLSADVRLLALGGDHTLPYGPVRAAARRFGPLAVIHIDAHQDSYSSRELGGGVSFINHGTFATDLANEGHIDVSKSSQVYVRTIQPETPGGGYAITYANDALAMGPEQLAAHVRDRVGNTPVYITLDIDALDPAFAPGNGSPVAGGPTTGELRRFLKGLDGLNVVAADLVEVNPLYDPTGATAIVAATLAIDLLYLMARADAAT